MAGCFFDILMNWTTRYRRGNCKRTIHLEYGFTQQFLIILYPLRRGTFNLGRENKITVTRSMGFLTEKFNFQHSTLRLVFTRDVKAS